jgi:hypothetical protein
MDVNCGGCRREDFLVATCRPSAIPSSKRTVRLQGQRARRIVLPVQVPAWCDRALRAALAPRDAMPGHGNLIQEPAFLSLHLCACSVSKTSRGTDIPGAKNACSYHWQEGTDCGQMHRVRLDAAVVLLCFCIAVACAPADTAVTALPRGRLLARNYKGAAAPAAAHLPLAVRDDDGGEEEGAARPRRGRECF